MTASTRGTVALLVVLGAVTVGLHVVQARSALASPDQEGMENILYVQSPEIATRAALSYRSLFADLYWIRAVQYYGRSRLVSAKDPTYGLLYPLLDLTTSLDPRFDIAYRFGAVFLAEPAPGGAGRPDQAIALLEKGLREQPGKWQFAGDIGFVRYFWLKDYAGAAEWFRRAGAMPNGPEWMAALAATVLNEGGNRASSRRLWQEILVGENPAYLREQAVIRLKQLDALDEIDTLTQLVSAYERRFGVRLGTWRPLVSIGALRQTPTDPSGAPYQLDPNTGEVSLAPDSTLAPLPQGESAR